MRPEVLDGLCAAGLPVCRDGVFGLNASAENVKMIRKLQEVYARYLIPVTDVIHSKSRSAHSTAEKLWLRGD
jgi:biotin synthase-like enzyme